jgi:hypothetical protein
MLAIRVLILDPQGGRVGIEHVNGRGQTMKDDVLSPAKVVKRRLRIADDAQDHRT